MPLIIPLTNGTPVGVTVMNKFINQAVVREKFLKIVQYVARLCAYQAKHRKFLKLHDHSLALSKILRVVFFTLSIFPLLRITEGVK